MAIIANFPVVEKAQVESGEPLVRPDLIRAFDKLAPKPLATRRADCVSSDSRQSSASAETPSALLSARVALSVKRATETMCANLHAIQHADARAKSVTMLMLLEVVGRASADPDTTVNQLLQALLEQVPEDTRNAAEGR